MLYQAQRYLPAFRIERVIFVTNRPTAYWTDSTWLCSETFARLTMAAIAGRKKLFAGIPIVLASNFMVGGSRIAQAFMLPEMSAVLTFGFFKSLLNKKLL